MRRLLLCLVLFTMLPLITAIPGDECPPPILTADTAQGSSPLSVTFSVDATKFFSCADATYGRGADFELFYTMEYGDGVTEGPIFFMGGIYTDAVTHEFTTGSYDTKVTVEYIPQDLIGGSVYGSASTAIQVCDGECLAACTENTCSAVSAACSCNGETASAGEYCYAGTVQSDQEASCAPQQTECAIDPCSPVPLDCTCGDAQAKAGKDFCIQTAPDTVSVSAEPGACLDIPTNVLVANGKMHMCGMFWEKPSDIVILHGLCDEEEDIVGLTYSCGVNSSGWWWFRNIKGVPFINTSNTTIMEVVDRDPDALTAEQREIPLLACVHGEIQEAITKYSPPPQLKQGACGKDMCYREKSATEKGCVYEGTNESTYQCKIYDDGAWWVSDVTRAAQAVIVYAKDPYILNCGPKQFSLNTQASEIPPEVGYCQLANLDNQGDAEKIYLAAAFSSGSEGDDPVSRGFILDELKKMHTEEDLGCLETDPVDCAFLTYDEEHDVGVFTDADSLGATGIGKIWDWITGLFGKDATPLTLKTHAASKLFIASENTMQYSVEYVSNTDCKSKQEIIGAEERTCFTDTAWRKVIQTR